MKTKRTLTRAKPTVAAFGPVLFVTEPHGAQALHWTESDATLANQVFTVRETDETPTRPQALSFTGWELDSLCAHWQAYKDRTRAANAHPAADSVTTFEAAANKVADDLGVDVSFHEDAGQPDDAHEDDGFVHVRRNGRNAAFHLGQDVKRRTFNAHAKAIGAALGVTGTDLARCMV